MQAGIQIQRRALQQTAGLCQGPTVARDINRGLLDLLERDGFDSIEDAVGADLD